MGHNITAIIIKGDYNKTVAAEYDLFPVSLINDLTLFHIDHYYSACWQHTLQISGCLDCFDTRNLIFPNEMALAEIVKRVTENEMPLFAIIATDWFGGMGGSCGNIFSGTNNVDKSITSVNGVLKYMGVQPTAKEDEWDVAGLYAIRSQPEYLDKYGDLADEYGV